MEKKSKLVLDKNTVKSIKIKTDVKTGDTKAGGSIGSNPAQTLSANYTRNVSGGLTY